MHTTSTRKHSSNFPITLHYEEGESSSAAALRSASDEKEISVPNKTNLDGTEKTFYSRPREYYEANTSHKTYNIESQQPTRAFLKEQSTIIKKLNKKELQDFKLDYHRQINLISQHIKEIHVSSILDIPTKNIISKKTGKEAIIFFSKDSHPDENLELLEKYLYKLVRFYPQAKGNEKRTLERHINLSVQYLVKSGWFDSMNTHLLGQVANKLSGVFNLASLPDALEWISKQVTQRCELDELDLIMFSFLVKAVSKNQNNKYCEECASYLADYLHRDPSILSEKNFTALANATNGFSRWPNNETIYNAITVIARNVKENIDHFKDINLFFLKMLCNAITKFPVNSSIQPAVESLAKKLLGKHYLWNELDIAGTSLLLNAFGKLPDSGISFEASEYLSDNIPLVINKEEMNGKDVAMILNTLSKHPKNQYFTKGAKVVAEKIIEDAEKLLHSFHDKAFPIVLNALQKWPDKAEMVNASITLAKHLSNNLDITDYFDEQDFSNISQALKQLPNNPYSLKVVEKVAKMICKKENMARELGELASANILGGICKWPENDHIKNAAMMILEYNIIHSIKRVKNPMHFGVILNASSKWPKEETCIITAKKIANEILDSKNNIITPDIIANNYSIYAQTINAFSKWPYHKSIEKSAKEINKSFLDKLNNTPNMEVNEVAIIFNALSKFSSHQESIDLINSLTKKIEGNLFFDKPSSRNIGMILGALSKFSDSNSAEKISTILANHINENERLINDFTLHGIISAITGFMYTKKNTQKEKALSSFITKFNTDKNLHKQLNSYSASSLLYHLSSSYKIPGVQKLVEFIISRLDIDEKLKNESIYNTDTINHLLISSIYLRKKPYRSDLILDIIDKHHDSIDDILSKLDPIETGRLYKSYSRINTIKDELKIKNRIRLCKDILEKIEENISISPNKIEYFDLESSLSLLENTSKNNREKKPIFEEILNHLVSIHYPFPRKETPKVFYLLSQSINLGKHINTYNKIASDLFNDDYIKGNNDPESIRFILVGLSAFPEKKENKIIVDSLSESVKKLLESNLCTNNQSIAILQAFSKWPDEQSSWEVAQSWSNNVLDKFNLSASTTIDCVNILNSFSKWPSHKKSWETVNPLLQKMQQNTSLIGRFTPSQCVIGINALSHWNNRALSQEIILQLAQQLTTPTTKLEEINTTDISLVLNALRSLPQTDDFKDTANKIVQHLAQKPSLIQESTAHQDSLIINALHRLQYNHSAHQICLTIIRKTSASEESWKDHSSQDIAMQANAIAGLAGRESSEDDYDSEKLELYKSCLQTMTTHLKTYNSERFNEASVHGTSLIMKALASMRMYDQMAELADPIITKIEKAIDSSYLNRLEGIGTTCMGLLPYIRSEELRPYQKRVLMLYKTLQPNVKAITSHALDILSQEHISEDKRLSITSRCPALNFYQILKSYFLVASKWVKILLKDIKGNLSGGSKPKNQELRKQHTIFKAQQDDIQAWVGNLLEMSKKLLLSEMDTVSWNLIAQIESDGNVFDALDIRLFKEHDLITHKSPPSKISLAKAKETLSGPLHSVPSTLGATQYTLVNIQGTELPNNDYNEKPYSLYARITGLPLVEVQLPGDISPFMLARTFTHKEEQWRFDMMGGSRFQKSSNLGVKAILHGQDSAYDTLPAFRYSDSAPNSDFIKLLNKLAPQREDWSRMQRALLEMVPHSHVAEGTLKIGWCDDVDGARHPFKLISPEGEKIALCPNDGCGFLKYEVAKRIPIIADYIDAWEAVQHGSASKEQQILIHKESSTLPSTLPLQALYHFPKDQEMMNEAHSHLESKLANLSTQKATAAQIQSGNILPQLSMLELYNYLTSGGYSGVRVLAIPSADDKLYLPDSKSQAFDRAGGAVLVGKPPYDKENLLPIPETRIGSVKKGDRTSVFLSQQCFAMQYSYTGFDDHSGSDPDMLHSKGMLIIPFPGYWSPDHKELDMVCSKEDLKILSRWQTSRDRHNLPEKMQSSGSLRVKDVFLPGTLGALPIAELRKRDMDTDGDNAFIYAGYPKLTSLIERTMQERQKLKGQTVSFKPPKTARSATNSQGDYNPGRLKEMLDVKKGRTMLGDASTQIRKFTAQPDDIRQSIATSFMMGTYDGIERSLKKALLEECEADETDSSSLIELHKQAHSAIAKAHGPEAKEIAQLLSDSVKEWLESLQNKTKGQPLSEPKSISQATCQRFESLANDYQSANTYKERVEAIILKYPVIRISNEEHPKGQPGYIEGQPDLSTRNLFTMAQKVGTDALKTDVGIQTFSEIVDLYKKIERKHENRVQEVPYTKRLAKSIYNNTLDVDWCLKSLDRNPTAAAALMETNIGILKRHHLIPDISKNKIPAEDKNAEAQGVGSLALSTTLTDAHATSSSSHQTTNNAHSPLMAITKAKGRKTKKKKRR